MKIGGHDKKLYDNKVQINVTKNHFLRGMFVQEIQFNSIYCKKSEICGIALKKIDKIQTNVTLCILGSDKKIEWIESVENFKSFLEKTFKSNEHIVVFTESKTLVLPVDAIILMEVSDDGKSLEILTKHPKFKKINISESFKESTAFQTKHISGVAYTEFSDVIKTLRMN